MASGLEQVLQHLLFPSNLEIVYIAFDFENPANIFKRNSHGEVGVSFFDPRELHPGLAEPILPSYNFVVGRQKYCDKASAKFAFGESKNITANSILENINRCIPSRDRNIVIVLHGGCADMKVLNEIGFDLQSVLAVVDTFSVAEEMKMKHFNLCDLLYELRSPQDKSKFHCAGNDANFTLKALILLALKACDERHWLYEERKLRGQGEVCLWRRVAFRAIAMQNSLAMAESSINTYLEDRVKEAEWRTAKRKKSREARERRRARKKLLPENATKDTSKAKETQINPYLEQRKRQWARTRARLGIEYPDSTKVASVAEDVREIPNRLDVGSSGVEYSSTAVNGSFSSWMWSVFNSHVLEAWINVFGIYIKL